jgi:hypothetical protein
MEKNKKTALTHYMIGSALIWAATIIGCALMLKETYSEISVFLNSAAALHLIITWSLLAGQCKKQGEESLTAIKD